jgi:hypothetical protein
MSLCARCRLRCCWTTSSTTRSRWRRRRSARSGRNSAAKPRCRRGRGRGGGSKTETNRQTGGDCLHALSCPSPHPCLPPTLLLCQESSVVRHSAASNLGPTHSIPPSLPPSRLPSPPPPSCFPGWTSVGLLPTLLFRALLLPHLPPIATQPPPPPPPIFLPHVQVSSPIEPLLVPLLKGHIDDADLSAKIARLFEVILSLSCSFLMFNILVYGHASGPCFAGCVRTTHTSFITIYVSVQSQQ